VTVQLAIAKTRARVTIPTPAVSPRVCWIASSTSVSGKAMTIVAGVLEATMRTGIAV
jgi:hypothetical protein